MMKKFLKQLSNYPRLRILLLIVLVIVIFILVGNVIGSLSSTKNKPPMPPSHVQTPQGQATAAPKSLTTEQYHALSSEVRKAKYEAAVDHGQTILPSSVSATPVAQASAPAAVPTSSQAAQASMSVHASTQATTSTPVPSDQPLNYEALVKQADQANQPPASVKTQETQPAVSIASTASIGSAGTTPSTVDSSAQPSPSAMNAAEVAMKRAMLMRESGVASQDQPYAAQGQSPEAVENLAHSMQSQMRSLSDHWSLHPLQTVSGPQVAAPTASGPAPKAVVITAGSVYYGVLMTAVDSDQPSAPILAQIVSGPFNGARLMGGFKLEGEKLVVNFTSMTLPHMGHSISINAYAINGVTAQNALASNVDNHYLYRYGSLFAAAFLEGFGNAYSTWNPCAYGVTTCTIIGNDVAPPPTTTQQAVYHGLGQVGTTMGQEIGQNFNMPPTVTLDQGMGIGVLFMADVSV